MEGIHASYHSQSPASHPSPWNLPSTLQPHGPSSRLSLTGPPYAPSLLPSPARPMATSLPCAQHRTFFLLYCPLLRTGLCSPNPRYSRWKPAQWRHRKNRCMALSKLSRARLLGPQGWSVAPQPQVLTSGRGSRDQSDTLVPSTARTPLCVVLRLLNSLQRTGLQTAWGRQVSRPGEAHSYPAWPH